jgi:D-alanyl-D-alanine carboxypeptidase
MATRKAWWVAVALLFVVACGARADDIDDYVTLQMQRQHVPGLTLGVLQQGRVVRVKGYGMADVERQVRATPDTVYEIGSITKQFTAVALMLLVERGSAGLDDPLGQYLDDIPTHWKPVTLRQLLTHTSGVPDYEAVMGYDSYRNLMKPQDVYAYVAAKPLDFAPGSKWNYSNTGYFLLTQVIEKLGGEPYATFVSRNVLAPAGMTHTRDSSPTDLIQNRAAGYEFTDKLRNRDAIQPSATGGAGMLVATAGDMLRWSQFVARRALLKAASWDQIVTEAKLSDGTGTGYGFGWFTNPMHGHRSLNHSGGTAGFTANLLLLPDDALTIVVLANSGSANPNSITDHIARDLVPALRYTAIQDSRPEISARVLEFYRHRADAEPWLEPFTPEFAAQVRTYWSYGVEGARERGPPAGIELVEKANEKSLCYRVRFAHETRIVALTLDQAGKITDMNATEE